MWGGSGKRLLAARGWGAGGRGRGARGLRLCVVGGAGELGRAACLLLRAEPRLRELRLVDEPAAARCVARQLGAVPAPARVSAAAERPLGAALRDAHVVLVAGGRLARPGLAPRALAAANREYVRRVAAAVSRVQPPPFVGLATEPVAELLPLFAAELQSRGAFDRRRLAGITGADELRAGALWAAEHGLQWGRVPLLGGHSRRTLVPLLSAAEPAREMAPGAAAALSERIRGAYDAELAARGGHAPVLAAAYSVAQFTRALAAALSCADTPHVHAMVQCNDFGTGWLAGRVRLTADGVGDMERYWRLTPYECELLEASCRRLRDHVRRATEDTLPAPAPTVTETNDTT